MASVKLGPGVETFLREIDLLDQADHIFHRSARVSLPEGNRRYHHWVLLVTGNEISRITDIRTGAQSKAPVDPARPLAKGEFVVWEDCEACGATGCGKCDKGLVRVIRREKALTNAGR